ncbi:unnamed protein product [Darwinula stevensoni]|uniref:Latrophilin Cirl n=1 Tax=Darwinula stevensoni TaxID=69355 RepID=A0A7R9A8C7_9CRUS|nr:unnamed protein product [Darwinula stevensoni]CAG0896252.1 unnamed protein product [Darwinula stevensoni]
MKRKMGLGKEDYAVLRDPQRKEGENGVVAERSRYRTAYACEGGVLNLRCGDDHVIHLIRANYGRFSIAICNEHGRTDMSVNCMSPMSLRVLHTKCSDHEECSVSANSTLFGDPCPGTLKYLEAHYQCLPAAEATTAKSKPPPPPPWLRNPTQPPKTMGPTVSEKTTSTVMTTVLPPETKRELLLSLDQPIPTLPGLDKIEESSTTRHISQSTTWSSSTTSPSTTTVAASTTRRTEATTKKPSPAVVEEEREEGAVRPSKGDKRENNNSGGWKQVGPRDACPPKAARGLYWNWTDPGETAIQLCPGGANGYARWECLGPAWDSPHADLSDCSSIWLTNLQSRVSEGESPVIVSTDLAQVASSKSLYGGDLWTSAHLFQILAVAASEADVQMASEILSNVIRAGSEILGVRQRASWWDLPPLQRRQAGTRLLMAFESNTFALSNALEEEQSVMLIQENLALSLHALGSPQVHPVEFPSERMKELLGRKVEVHVYLPPQALQGHTSTHSGLKAPTLGFLMYETLNDILPPHKGDTPQGNESKLLNSRVVSVSLDEGRHVQLPHPVILTFQHLKKDNVSNPVCVFWDYTTSGWSEEGCRVMSWNASHTRCECDHLTHFAVLMDLHETELAPGHEMALQVITYIGCSISVVCLLASILTFRLFRSLKSDRTVIHENLCACLLLAELIFLIGIGRTEHRIACGIVAGLLHFFFLTAFAWMFFEGFQLYVMLIEVFESERSRVRWYYFLGYGIPLVIVVISAAIDPASYGTPQHCWLRTDNHFIFSFLGPVIVVLLANFAFLFMAVYVMCRHATVTAGLKEQTRLSTVGVWVRGAFALVVLLGLTWTFGFLYVNEESLVMAYVFTVFNSLQGLFIFLFTCLQNDKVKKEYRKLMKRGECLPSCCGNKPDKRNSFYVQANASSSSSTGTRGVQYHHHMPTASTTTTSSIAQHGNGNCYLAYGGTAPEHLSAMLTLKRCTSSQPGAITRNLHQNGSFSHLFPLPTPVKTHPILQDLSVKALDPRCRDCNVVGGTVGSVRSYRRQRPCVAGDGSLNLNQYSHNPVGYTLQHGHPHGLLRPHSPWNHTYSEIHVVQRDPEYAEIEHRRCESYPTDEELMRRQNSDVSRYSTRSYSYSDSRPLIPGNNILDTISCAVHSPQLNSRSSAGNVNNNAKKGTRFPSLSKMAELPTVSEHNLGTPYRV